MPGTKLARKAALDSRITPTLRVRVTNLKEIVASAPDPCGSKTNSCTAGLCPTGVQPHMLTQFTRGHRSDLPKEPPMHDARSKDVFEKKKKI